VGVATTDFALFADVVESLKQAGIPFVDCDPQGKVPGNVGVVVTSAKEASQAWPEGGHKRPETPSTSGTEGAYSGERETIDPQLRWKGCRVLALGWDDLLPGQRDRELALLPFRVMWALAGYPLLWVGVDPGPRPGIAILASGTGTRAGTGAAPSSPGLLVDYQAADEEQALAYLRGVLRAVGPGMMVVRVGHGAPLPRNRLANGVMEAATTLWGDGSTPDVDPEPGPDEQDAASPGGTASISAPAVAVEIVDETGSSSGTRKESNLAAAARIATVPGYRLSKPLRTHVKPTDITKVQERSRLKTGGLRTLSAKMAEAVAAGELTMEEALERDAKEAEMA